MSSRHSALITGAPSGIGAVDADCFARRRRQLLLEDDIHREERCRKRRRIVHELHDSAPGFLDASMLLDHAVEQKPDDSRSKPALSRALRLVRRAIDEGRAALRGLRTVTPTPSSLEQALSNLLADVTPA